MEKIGPIQSIVCRVLPFSRKRNLLQKARNVSESFQEYFASIENAGGSTRAQTSRHFKKESFSVLS